MKPMAIAGIIAMTVVTGAASASDNTLHNDWDVLLQTYVVEGEDGLNRFDYGALKAEPADVEALDEYLDQFAAFDFDTLNRDEQFAAWANIYNALTVKHIVGRYPVRSIRSGYISGPWKKVKVTVDGQDVSLDEIEHKILRPMGDARVHYAINCASYSCPNLEAHAWQAETLDEDLDAAAHDYINHPRGVSIRARGGLEVSAIYKWFQDDFGGNEKAVITHFLKYADDDLAAQIEANADIKKYEYDWSLNDVLDASSDKNG